MNMEQLRQLVTVAETGVVSHAADELDISQPALSRSLKRLEDELGTELFDRTKNSVALNEAGLLAVEYAREILRSEERMREELDRAGRAEHTVRIGTVAPAPLWMLTSWIVDDAPGILVSAETLEAAALERRFLEGSLDIAITGRPVHLPAIFSAPLLTESLALWAPVGHRLASRESVCFADLAGEQILVQSDIGSWAMVHDQIDADFVIQHDVQVFRQLLRGSELLAFTTNAVAFMREADIERVVVPISDSLAHATFYLNYHEDSPRHASLMRALRRRIGS